MSSYGFDKIPSADNRSAFRKSRRTKNLLGFYTKRAGMTMLGRITLDECPAR
jgi:hypothetical protein